MTTDQAKEVRAPIGVPSVSGGWRWFVLLGLFFASQIPTILVDRQIDLANGALGSEAVWRMIYADCCRGGLALLSLGVMLALLVRTWRRYRFFNELLLLLTCILLIPAVVVGLAVVQHCPALLAEHPGAAPWATPEAYFQARLQFVPLPVGLIIGALAVSPFVWNKIWRSETRPSSQPGADEA